VRGAGTTGGRVVEDFVNLMDLAPTFVELGGLKPPSVMTGRSLLPILRSEKSGQVEAGRSFVVTGRERHVESAREGFLPYPQRALRNARFAYIRNFKPDRWPQYPLPLRPGEATDGDFDGGPTKAWFAQHQSNGAYASLVELAVGLRPSEEFYDLAADPDQMKNLAESPEHQAVKARLAERLMNELTDKGDPRVVGEGDGFDRPPYLKAGER